MCLHGIYKKVNIINQEQNKKRVVIDACIANEIRYLNEQGVITLSCCCGHGKAGQIAGWENDFGKWKGHYLPPHTLLASVSVKVARELGYRPYPYYYTNGEHKDVWQMILKTGCMTEMDCNLWHLSNNQAFEEGIGVIE